MFATLLGALPRLPAEPSIEDEIREAMRTQETAGLEPITDGRLRGDLASWAGTDGAIDVDAVVSAWQFASAQTDRAVKQAVPGPYSIGRREAAEAGPARDTAARTTLATRAAETLREVVLQLAGAGCPMIEIEETHAHLIGVDEEERALFREAHARLTEGIAGIHLSLSIVGGSAWDAGIETILDAPYASLAVDLIDGPDNWNLVTRLPGDRGVIAGALPAKDSPADTREMLLWAARHAAGSRGRGIDRVGIGSAGSWANLTWEVAIEKIRRLGEAARVAQVPAGRSLARQLDPRAVNARTAAMGHAPGKRSPGDSASADEAG